MAERSPLLVILEKWVPVLLTVGVGAYLARVIFPRIQAEYQKGVSRHDRMHGLAEEIAVNFDRYISEWRRLVQMSEHFRDKEMDETETKRFEAFVDGRKEARDRLMAAF
jgi:hypothetical protein